MVMPPPYLHMLLRVVLFLLISGSFSYEIEWLLNLYTLTNGDHWENKENWNDWITSYRNQSSVPCYAVGIECDNRSHLRGINFQDNSLRGSIHSSISFLSNLEQLILTSNLLEGTVPSQLGLLSNLATLDLFNNILDGTIPSDIGLLSNLNYLSVDLNNLNGPIPSEIGLLTALSYLSLSMNQLAESIPSEIGLLTALSYLDLSINALDGTIPTACGLLSQLVFLDLSCNNLEGSIPIVFGSLSRLEVLSLHENQLKGTVPSSIGRLSALRLLDVQNTQLSGTLPASFADGLPAVLMSGTTLTYGHLTVKDKDLIFHGDLATNSLNITGSSVTVKGDFAATTSLSIKGNLTIQKNMQVLEGTIYLHISSVVSVGDTTTLSAVTIQLDLDHQLPPSTLTLISSPSSDLQNVSFQLLNSPSCLTYSVSQLKVTMGGCSSVTEYVVYIVFSILLFVIILLGLVYYFIRMKVLEKHLENIEQ